MSNNTITLCGRIGQDPKVATTPTGKNVVTVGLAVKEYSPDGEDATMWIDIEFWNGLGDRASKVLTKGREIVVTGRLVIKKTDKYTKAFVRVSNFHLCGPKPDALKSAAVSLSPSGEAAMVCETSPESANPAQS